ncbi:MAG: PilZ domain-containing protein [Deferrisomatales bacterium]|nr:PilZ domain-containing protein [Deferrisomatales bacterium]
MNRRRGHRQRTRISIAMDPGGITSYSGDVSCTGVFVYSSRVHRPGTRVRVVLRTPGGPVTVPGVVRWAKRVPPQFLQQVRGGMGVEFTSMPPELFAYLNAVLPSGCPLPEPTSA